MSSSRDIGDLIAGARAQAKAARKGAAGLRGRSLAGARAALGTVLSPGALIEGYEIIAEHHRGGQGVVYRAIQLATRREVALKVLYHSPGGGRANRIRFEREVQVLAQLHHPHIVTIHDSATVGDCFWYAMDFVDGTPLDLAVAQRDPWVSAGALALGQAAARQRRVDANSVELAVPGIEGGPPRDRASSRDNIRETLRLFVKICSAMHAAHVRGVIHRDIKPANILVQRDGEPKVVDFGLATFDGSADVTHMLDVSMTRTGQFVGSLPWSSPEQADGQPVDTRSDVYSLGVLLFQMLTGMFPYAVTGTMAQTLQNIREREPLVPSALRRGISDELDTIVRRCLAKERERRYQTAGELGADVARYLAGEPIEAKRDSTMYVLRKTLTRYRGRLAVVAALLLVMLAGGITSAWLWRRAEGAQAAADKRFSDLRRFANSFIHEFDPQLQGVPGTLPARRYVAKVALEYLNELEGAAGADPQLRLELAQGYLQLGKMLGSPGYPNLGDTDGASDSLRKARDVLLQLLAEQPENGVYFAHLSQADFLLGDVRLALGDVAGAIEAHERRLSSIREIHQRRRDAKAGADLASSLSSFAMVLQDADRDEEANRLLEEATQVFAGLPAEEVARDPAILRTMALHWSYVGHARSKAGDDPAARAARERALREFEELARRFPDALDAQADIAVALIDVAAEKTRVGDFAGAEADYLRAVKIREDILERDQGNAQALRRLALAEYYTYACYYHRAAASGWVGPDALEALTAARQHLRRSVRHWDALSEGAGLNGPDAAQAAEARGRLPDCDEKIATARVRDGRPPQ